MSKYDSKFGFREDKDTTDFHKSRRMFVIKGNKLIIAEPHLPYSHPVWFEKEGWMGEDNEQFMKNNARGAIMQDGEIRFYVDWDFKVNEVAEQQFMPHLKGLVDNLSLDISAQLNGGQIKDEGFRPRKLYGTIADNLG